MQACARCGQSFEPAASGTVICPSCEFLSKSAAQNEPDFTHATSVETPAQTTFEQHAPAEQPRRRGMPEGFYQKSPTVWLIVLNVIYFLVSCALSKSVFDISVPALIKLGANYGPLTLSGQEWRLLAAIFLHGGILHIALNMWALFNLGTLAEILFGRRSYTMLYLAAGIGSSIASTWWHFHTGNGATISVGASGAIFGIAGALIPALAFQKNARLRVALRGNLTTITIFVLYSVVYSVAAGPQASHIDNSAHIGGLAIGIVLGLLLPSSPGYDQEHHATRRVAVTVLTIAAIVGSVFWLQKAEAAPLEYARGREALLRKDMNTAVEHLRRSLELDPHQPAAHYTLGLISLQGGDNKGAVAELTQAAQLDPKFADAHAQLCIAYLRLENVASALAECERSTQLDQEDSDKFFNLALVRRASGDRAGALEAFHRATTLRPEGSEEAFMYGESLAESGRIQDAEKELQRAIELNRNDPRPRRALARLYLAQGRSEEAQNVLRGK